MYPSRCSRSGRLVNAAFCLRRGPHHVCPCCHCAMVAKVSSTGWHARRNQAEVRALSQGQGGPLSRRRRRPQLLHKRVELLVKHLVWPDVLSHGYLHHQLAAWKSQLADLGAGLVVQLPAVQQFAAGLSHAAQVASSAQHQGAPAMRAASQLLRSCAANRQLCDAPV